MSSEKSFKVPKLTWQEVALIALAMGFMAIILAYAALRSAPLLDECAHYASGVVLAATGDPGYFKVNPPANKWVTAITVSFLPLDLPPLVRSSAFSNATRPEFDLGDSLLARDPDRFFLGLRLSRVARIPLLLVGAAMLWSSLSFAEPWRRVLVVWLWCFSPLLLGHGWVVSADALAGVAMCLVIVTGVSICRRPTYQNFAMSGLAWGLAIGTKTTFAPLYLAFIVSVGITKYVWGGRTSAKNGLLMRQLLSLFTRTGHRNRLRTWFLGWVWHASVACLTLNALYLFDGSGRQLRQHEFISPVFRSVGMHRGMVSKSVVSQEPEDLEKPKTAVYGSEGVQKSVIGDAGSWVARWLSTMPSPFPESFLEGIDQQLADMAQPRGAYLLGKRHPGKLPWFFLLGYWAKEQLAVPLMLLFVVLGIAYYLRKKSSGGAQAPCALVACFPRTESRLLTLMCGSLLIAFGVLMAWQSNLVWNMRYLIPALPLVYVLLVLGVPEFEPKLTKLLPRGLPVMCLGLLATMLMEAIGSVPFHFSYINPLFGGSRRIPFALNDSNFDYGQDIFYVRDWCAKQMQAVTDNAPQRICGVLCGHGRIWLQDICPAASSQDIEHALQAKRDQNAETRNGMQRTSPDGWLIISRGLGHPEPWAVRYSSITDAQLERKSRLQIQELLNFPPDVWITPVIVGYRLQGE
ncbi:MAG: hypothetical protein KDB03_15025 [Planctomycetales bacterium]|nr:hypothetical protein [Planctomycetales bacterium]